MIVAIIFAGVLVAAVAIMAFVYYYTKEKRGP